MGSNPTEPVAGTELFEFGKKWFVLKLGLVIVFAALILLLFIFLNSKDGFEKLLKQREQAKTAKSADASLSQSQSIRCKELEFFDADRNACVCCESKRCYSDEDCLAGFMCSKNNWCE